MSSEAKAYQQEILHRGAVDRISGKGLDENPYRSTARQWPELLIESLRLSKHNFRIGNQPSDLSVAAKRARGHQVSVLTLPVGPVLKSISHQE